MSRYSLRLLGLRAELGTNFISEPWGSILPFHEGGDLLDHGSTFIVSMNGLAARAALAHRWDLMR